MLFHHVLVHNTLRYACLLTLMRTHRYGVEGRFQNTLWQTDGQKSINIKKCLSHKFNYYFWLIICRSLVLTLWDTLYSMTCYRYCKTTRHGESHTSAMFTRLGHLSICPSSVNVRSSTTNSPSQISLHEYRCNTSTTNYVQYFFCTTLKTCILLWLIVLYVSSQLYHNGLGKVWLFNNLDVHKEG